MSLLPWLRTPPVAAKDSRDQTSGQAKQFVDEKHPEWVSMARADLEEEDYTI